MLTGNMEKPGVWQFRKKKIKKMESEKFPKNIEKPGILNKNLKKPGIINNFKMFSSKILIWH